MARGKPLIISNSAAGGALRPARARRRGQFVGEGTGERRSTPYNLRMFENVPNLRGVSPWILFDFRSPFLLPGPPTGTAGTARTGFGQGYRRKREYLMKELLRQTLKRQ